MAEEREGATGYALVERASELCQQVYERLELGRVQDPGPRDFVRELLILNMRRFLNTGHGFSLDLMNAAAWYLVPPCER